MPPVAAPHPPFSPLSLPSCVPARLSHLPSLAFPAVIVAVGLACVAAFALVKRSRRRNFTEAGGNSSKFARFDDETTLPAAGLPVFTAAPSLTHVELSPGGTARGTAPPDAPNPWAHS